MNEQQITNIRIAKSRINKLGFILKIKQDETIKISNKTIEKIKTVLPLDVYNNIFKDNQLLVIAMILINTKYNHDKQKKMEDFQELENLLFSEDSKFTWDYDEQIDPRTKGYYENILELMLIKKILIKDLKIDETLFNKIIDCKLLNKINVYALLQDNYYIVKMILLCKDLSIQDNYPYYKIFQDIILNPNAKRESFKTDKEFITGGKKKTKYNIFMSKELKRLKKINPDKDYKLRFKEAVNNWKNKK